MNPINNKVILLCATQRCGSTMIVEDMRSTGVLGIPEEYFIPWDVSKERINWREQLENIISSKASTDNGVASIKIMANQLPEIEKCLASDSSIKPADGGGLCPHFRSYFASAKYVFIRRDNVVRQAISRSMSRQTGINHATKNSSDDHFAGNLMKGYDNEYNSGAKFSKEQIDSDILNIVKENLLWESYFSSWDITHPLSLRYEELCKNGPAYLQRIGKYSGIEVTQEMLPESRKMVKLSNSKNEDWCSEYLGQNIPSA